MANPTTNLGMTKPTVGGSTDTWGTTINEEVVDILDALFSVSGTDVTMSDITFNSMSVQETGAGTDTVKIQAPAAVTTAYTLTMPAAVGSINQVLSAADGSGTLAWTTPEVGDITAIVAGAGLTGTSLSGPIPTLNVIGTADKVTVSADAVTIASTYVGQTSITTLGTVATGVWDAGALTTSGDVTLSATNKVYLDGGTHSYLHEVSPDQIDVVAGGVSTLRVNATGVGVNRAPLAASVLAITGDSGRSAITITQNDASYSALDIDPQAAYRALYVRGTSAVSNIFGELNIGSTGASAGTGGLHVTGSIIGLSTLAITGTTTTGALTAVGNIVSARTGATAHLAAVATTSGSARVQIESTTSGNRLVEFRTAGTTKWRVGVNADISSGSKFGIYDGTTNPVFEVADGAVDVTFAGDLTADTVQGTTGTGSLYLRGDSGASSGIKIDDDGTMSFGSTPQTNRRVGTRGSFTAVGSNESSDWYLAGTLTGASGNTQSLAGFTVATEIITQTATEDVGVIASLLVREPQITDNLTGDITVASTVYIQSAPTEGNGVNASLYVAAGDVILTDGDLVIERGDKLYFDGESGVGGGEYFTAGVGTLSLYVGGVSTMSFADNGIGIKQGSGLNALAITETNSGVPAFVINAAHATGPEGIEINYTGGAPNGTGDLFIVLADTSATRGEWRSNGGIANYQSNDTDLSDERLKVVHGSTESKWEAHAALEVIDYNYSDSPDTRLLIGVGAHQAGECDERLCATDGWETGGETYHGTYSKDLTFYTMKTVQECQARIEALEAALAAL